MLIYKKAKNLSITSEQVVDKAKNCNYKDITENNVLDFISGVVIQAEWELVHGERVVLTVSSEQLELFGEIGGKIIAEMKKSQSAFESILAISKKSPIFREEVIPLEFGNGIMWYMNLGNCTFYYLEDQFCFFNLGKSWEMVDFAVTTEADLIKTFNNINEWIAGLIAYTGQHPGVIEDGVVEKVEIFHQRRGRIGKRKKQFYSKNISLKHTREISSHFRRGHLRFLTHEKYRGKRFSFIEVKSAFVKAKAQHIENK